ncbi:MAG: hypothetical protein IT212_00375 [Bacteroidia bacterium]|nr:hypothetical protein [Bacteroidia bacterium]
MLSLVFFLLLLRGNAQVANDSCLSATNLGLLPIGSVLSVPCLSGAPEIFIADSTTMAVANYPYPSIPNGCNGYVSTVASPAKDRWYKFTVNCDFTFRVENSDTLHLSFWLGDSCSNLLPIECFTIPANTTFIQALSGLGGHWIYLQISGQDNINANHYNICFSTSIPMCAPSFNLGAFTPVLCFDYNLQVINSTSASINDGGIIINITEGNPPYTCSWSDGATGFIRDSLQIGHYTFTIVDGIGCELTDSVTVGIITIQKDIIENDLHEIKILFNNLNHTLLLKSNSSSIIGREINLSIFDIGGQKVFNNKTKANIPFEFYCKNGIYLFQISVQNCVINKKIYIN